MSIVSSLGAHHLIDHVYHANLYTSKTTMQRSQLSLGCMIVLIRSSLRLWVLAPLRG